MRYQTLIQAIKEVSDSHKADPTFVTGLESDINPSDSTKYPVTFLPPPKFGEPVSSETIASNTTWTIHLESQELLSDTSSTDQKQEALDRTREILRDIYFRFVLKYGYDGETVTVNNVSEETDFIVSTAPEFAPFISIGDNITGWQVDFSIQEGVNNDLCHLDDVFS
tara:strand:- start:551 stop:1051 length:501 start_codon:yes stop_codon:yes gene_type:complete